MKKSIFIAALGFIILGCQSYKKVENYSSETLKIEKLAEGVYQHISYLSTDNFGKVACNGMIVFKNGEAIVFDTPTDDEVSSELIDWVENELKAKVKAVIPTHFHEDCLGGLEAFHQKQIPSYAHQKTISLIEGLPIPQNSFEELLHLKVGNEDVLVEYFGEGHTQDNVVGYFPSSNTIFGGCMIKSLKAGKGNLADANVSEWSLTVTKLKNKYPNVQLVIPGHGKPGNVELLDYTIEMFRENQ